MRFSPPPLHRSLPFLCLHVFIRVCIRLRGRRQKERERGGRGEEEEEEKKGEGNALFSPSASPSPALSRLGACHEDQICIYETIVKTLLHFLHIFNRFVSWEIIIPPHFQTPFQRNLLTSSGIPRREISREQLPTPELLEKATIAQSQVKLFHPNYPRNCCAESLYPTLKVSQMGNSPYIRLIQQQNRYAQIKQLA